MTTRRWISTDFQSPSFRFRASRRTTPAMPSRFRRQAAAWPLPARRSIRRGGWPGLRRFRYDYNDLGGAVNAYWSAGELRRGGYDALMPSLGEPIFVDVDGALVALEGALTRLCAGRPHERGLLKVINEDSLERVTDHVWMEPLAEAASWYLDQRERQGAGHGLRLPWRLRRVAAAGSEKKWQWPSYSYRSRRRPLLHGVSAALSGSSASTASTSR